MSTYKHLAVIGRVDGDDEDSILLYENLDTEEAEARFKVDVQSAVPVEDHRPDEEIYINYVLTSDSPINITRSYTGA